MLKKLTLMLLVALVAFIGCQEETKQPQQETTNPNSQKVTVVEVLQANSYTYLKVKDDQKEYWIAATKMNVEAGETVYHTPGMEMKDFESKDLNRKFELVLFVQTVSKQPIGMPAASPHSSSTPAHPETQKGEKIEEQIAAPSGGITIAKLFEDSKSLSRKKVKLKGKVTKFNAEIMGRNWVHIQDGTEYYGEFDITITTKDQVNVGDVVAFEGTVTLDKDFGAGYKYKVIIEDASLIK